jgi:serine/threonine-protein kinase
MRPQVGQVINNKYRLLRLIGDGGMGAVYEARHEVLGTSVALKFLHVELTRRQGLVQRFLQEARVSAQITSPHVVRVTDVDQTPSGAFIVMEYLEGRTLQRLYEELYGAGQQLSYESALEYSMQMLEGVEAAHKQGIVHRDLKPDNVMITPGPKGRPLLKLLDFGIAKLKVEGQADRGLTRPGVIMGTPEYMAPEQAYSADAVDVRADIFSLGVMIFEMLAGRRPVGGDEPQQIATAYISGRIAHLTELLPTVSLDLAAAVHKAMAAMPRDRWQTVTAFRDALEPFAIAAKAPSVMPPGASMSNPGLSRAPHTPDAAAATPPATNVGGAPGAVPDTRSPAPDPTNPADPPEMSAPRRYGPTPIGGFVLGDLSSSPGLAMPATRSAAPYVPAVDGGATAFAAPLGGPSYGGMDARASLDLSPRPSGTAFGEPAQMLAGAAGPLPSAYTPAILAAPLPATPKRASRGSGGLLSSLPFILLLAAGAAGLAVGGVYLAQSSAKVDEHEDPPPPPTAATVSSDPPVEVPTALPPATAPTFKPALPPQPPRKGYPSPRGSGSPNQPPPAPSTTPSSRVPILPSVLPPIVIPTAFPFAFPFAPSPRRDDPPRTQPDDPPRRRRDQGRETPSENDDVRPRGRRPGAGPYDPPGTSNDQVP